MRYRDVEFTVIEAEAGVWKFRFEIDGTEISGRAETRLQLMAIRRAQARIDRELKKHSTKD